MNDREPDFMALREALYLGPGYAVIRGFRSRAEVDYLRQFWTTHRNPTWVERYDKAAHLRPGCEDVSHGKPHLDRHHNFFWNRPLDPFSYTTGWELQALRNRIEGHPPNHDFMPHALKYRRDPDTVTAASYRVVLTREKGAVEPHVDWPLDHARVQLELMLSDYGADYSGGLALQEGLWEGSMINLCEKENLQAGDLVIFQYARRHEVRPITAPPGRPGFCRLMIPLNALPAATPVDPAPSSGWFRKKPPPPPKRDKTPDYDEMPYRDQPKRTHDPDLDPLVERAVRHGFAPTEVYYYRGLWARFNMFQDWQVETLMTYGLKPQHHLLDIGCGFLRLGMKLIPYLDDDRYCGIDPVAGYLELGRVYMKDIVGSEKTYHTRCTGDFDVAPFNRLFDVAMAHSVFTHLSFEQIRDCLRRLKPVMAPGGRLIFTIVLSREDREDPMIYAENLPITKSRHGSLD
ncbi:MAG: class I SAM-dependent methyltransferase, partial [Verrucomicrobiota bacterium]